MTFDRGVRGADARGVRAGACCSINARGARVVLVGANFRLGFAGAPATSRRSGRLGEDLGFETRSAPASSATPRGVVEHPRRPERPLARGDPSRPSGCCRARTWAVRRGRSRRARRGRTIGFPTCNIDEIEEALPPFEKGHDARRSGDLATWPRDRLARGVANLGVRPTAEASRQARPNPRCTLDVDEDLYGAALRVHLIARLREERRFSGLPELKAQIARDAEGARARSRRSARIRRRRSVSAERLRRG